MVSRNPHTANLPCTRNELQNLGWDHVDIVLVTGDCYIDHPAFGVAIIGRILASRGYRVAVLSQPRYSSADDFLRFGRPRLFFGITAGNLDSIVANYTGNGKVRDFDAFSSDGNPWRDQRKEKTNRLRPDRAVLIYSHLARQAYKDCTIVLGGIEASLRRFIHYDYKQNKLRDSFLTDAKADLLLYGMAEKSVVETAERLDANENLSGIQGSCIRLSPKEMEETFPSHREQAGNSLIMLPSRQEIDQDSSLFLQAEKDIDRLSRSCSQKVVVQKQKSHWLIQFPQADPLTNNEMDELYNLPFSRKIRSTKRPVPAYTMIRHSVTIVRGCPGNCSFCAISRHQGPQVTCRSTKSIVNEVRQISKMADFSGTISDLGGPTANLYGTRCRIGSCKKHDCLYPEVCKQLLIDETQLIELLASVTEIPTVKHCYISSGLRMELLLKTPKLLQRIIESHTPGALKIAPEHTEADVLKLMHKESHDKLTQLVKMCRNIGKRRNKSVVLNPYIILSHPGCDNRHNQAMVQKLKKLGLQVRQFQDFTPSPGTLSTAMYVSGLHRDNEDEIYIAKNQLDRKKQRELIERTFLDKKKSKKKRRQPIRKGRTR